MLFKIHSFLVKYLYFGTFKIIDHVVLQLEGRILSGTWVVEYFLLDLNSYSGTDFV